MKELSAFVNYRFFKDTSWGQIRVENPLFAAGSIEMRSDRAKRGKITIYKRNGDQEFIFGNWIESPNNDFISPPIDPEDPDLDLPCIDNATYLLFYGVSEVTKVFYRIENNQLIFDRSEDSYPPGLLHTKVNSFPIQWENIYYPLYQEFFDGYYFLEPRVKVIHQIGRRSLGSGTPSSSYAVRTGSADNLQVKYIPLDSPAGKLITPSDNTGERDFLDYDSIICGKPPTSKEIEIYVGSPKTFALVGVMRKIGDDFTTIFPKDATDPKNSNFWDEPYNKLFPEAKISKDCPPGFIKCLSDCPDGFCCVEDCR